MPLRRERVSAMRLVILSALCAVHGKEYFLVDSHGSQTRSLYMAAVQATTHLLKGRHLQQVVNVNGSPFSNPCVKGGGRTFCPIIVSKPAPAQKAATPAAVPAPGPGPQVAG